MTSTLFLSTESDEKHSAERSDLIQNARTHLLSGIASLPTEILSQIFVHVCQNTDLNAVLKGSQVPAARIASVCRFWRNICLAESCFWSSFAFDVGRPFEFFESWSVDSSMMLRVLKLFLQQSKSTKLNVSARFCLNDPCFEEFARHAERWAHVDLDVVLLTRDFNLLRNRLTALKTLSLRASHRQNYPNNHVVDAFENAPALCGLVLHGTMPSLPIPHNQIIDLTSDQPDASGMRLAQQCPNLRSLTLTPPASHDTHAHVTHKLLSSLTISLSADNYIADIGILARFTTPNLRSLRIQSSSWSTLFCWPQKDFLAFVNRSQPFSLYELVLDRVCTDMSGNSLSSV
ncbi:hypothetical protein FPV67DRAFT_791385 [Lyophyllum atratum]|nr:hypothetical protein FPV67DRAFT_791385 [Lyophyllum atratum]